MKSFGVCCWEPNWSAQKQAFRYNQDITWVMYSCCFTSGMCIWSWIFCKIKMFPLLSIYWRNTIKGKDLFHIIIIWKTECLSRPSSNVLVFCPCSWVLIPIPHISDVNNRAGKWGRCWEHQVRQNLSSFSSSLCQCSTWAWNDGFQLHFQTLVMLEAIQLHSNPL